MERNQKEKEFTTITLGPERRRYSDCCNAEILNSRCPKCGTWLEESQGKREIVIKGLDGKTTHKEPDILVAMVNDQPKKEDKMPPLFRELQNRGVKILNWSDSSV